MHVTFWFTAYSIKTCFLLLSWRGFLDWAESFFVFIFVFFNYISPTNVKSFVKYKNIANIGKYGLYLHKPGYSVKVTAAFLTVNCMCHLLQ